MPRRHVEGGGRAFFRKCGWRDAGEDGDCSHVGTWSEVGGCFAANAAGRMRPRAGKGGRVGMRKSVQGWFSANAAWGMLSMAGMADASACGGACGAVFPQMRSEDAAEGGERWTRRHVE